MFDELEITFLQNELLVIGDDFEIITESEIDLYLANIETLWE